MALVMLAVACGSAKQAEKPPILTSNTVINERLVPVVVPGDSSMIKAFFKCDSLNRVVMYQLQEFKSKRVSSTYDFITTPIGAGGAMFEYEAKTIRDTIYVPVKDTVIVRDKPIYVDNPNGKNQLTWIQKALMWCGAAFVLLVIASGYRFINRLIQKKHGSN